MWRRLIPAVLGVLLSSAPLEAQREAGRALAFVGCWEAADGSPAGAMTCVVPQEGPALAIIGIPSTGSRTESMVRLDGATHDVVSEGCTGWERARVSRDDERIVMDSEIACAGLPRQRRAGAFVILENGDWLQVQGGGVASIATTQVRRLRPVVGWQGIPSDLRSRIAPFIAEAEVTRASIAGRRVSSADLTELEAFGTAGPVIDLVVAASYPEAFAIVGGERETRSMRPEGSGVPSSVGIARGGFPYGTTPPPTATDWAIYNSCLMMWGIRDPWACAGVPTTFAYGPGWGWGFGWGWGWGIPRYGFGYAGWGPGYWPGTGGPVVVQPIGPGGVPGGRTPESGGRVVRGSGYVGPSGGGSPSRPRNSDGGSSVRNGSSSPSNGSGGSSSGASSGGSSSGGGGRTAKPRDP